VVTDRAFIVVVTGVVREGKYTSVLLAAGVRGAWVGVVTHHWLPGDATQAGVAHFGPVADVGVIADKR